MSRQGWHPVVSEVLALLVREDGGPTIEEQVTLAERISGLSPCDRGRVLTELATIGKKLRAAGELMAEACVRGIAALASHMESAIAIESRVFR